MANIHEHAVLSDVLERKGSGFTAHHGDDFLMANNAQWIGFSLEIGPDGALYVLDWHDADICGDDVLHQETGRIFRIAPTQSLAGRLAGPLLRSADDDATPSSSRCRRAGATGTRAARASSCRAAPRRARSAAETRAELLRMFKTDANPDWRLRAMWALHVTGGWTPDALVEALGGSRRAHPRLGDPAALRGSERRRRRPSRRSRGWRATIARRSCGSTWRRRCSAWITRRAGASRASC